MFYKYIYFNISKLCKEGLSKIGSVAAAPQEDKKDDKKDAKAAKKEEKPKEPEPEEEAGFGDLFG